MTVDLRLYAILDPEHAGGRILRTSPDWWRPAARRWCNCATSAARRARWWSVARAIKAALAPFGVPLLINDRVDVALAAGADGVHVGQDGHGGRGCAAAARAATRSSGCRSRPWRRRRRRRSICSTMSASAASMRPRRRTIPIRRSASRGFARIAERASAGARRAFRSCAHRRHRRRQCRPRPSRPAPTALR